VIAAILACVLPLAGLLSAQPGPEKDIVLQAMMDEIERTRALRVVGDPPYFVEYSLDDAEFYSVIASYGALMTERSNRIRQPRIRVRVGDPKLDNTNHVFSDVYRGARYDPSQFTLDDNYEALRIGFWLATDRSYKQAAEALARKKASIKNINVTELLPDFSPAPVVKLLLPAPRKAIDQAEWRNRVRQASTLFSQYPEVLQSDASANFSQTISYLVNNEGTLFRIPDHLSIVRVRASGQAPDGMMVWDQADFSGFGVDQTPTSKELMQAATQVAENVKALVSAPTMDNYAGPVLFEGAAAAQLIGEVLGRNLSIIRRPVTDPNRPLNLPAGDLEGRIGARILPEWMDVVDDPTQKEFQGKPLLGHYLIDIEGVRPAPLVMVEKGVLKSFYSTRQPIQGVESSNGHARLPGALGNYSATAGNLFLRAAQTSPAADLRKKLTDMGRQRNKPFVVVIRKLDFPSGASVESLRRIAGGQSSRATSIPLLAYRVYPDGNEELIRGVRFRGLTARSLRDIVAASDELHLFHFLENGAPFAHMDGGGYVAPTSTVSPSLLFEDLELERIPGELPKLPIVPPPALARSQ
jgi:predicted Zn-dependent protease